MPPMLTRAGVRRLVVLHVAACALALPAAAGAGVPLGDLALVYEGTNNGVFNDQPGRGSESSYQQCGGNTIPDTSVLSGGFYTENADQGQVFGVSSYPVDQILGPKPDSWHVDADNITAAAPDVQLIEQAVCGGVAGTSYRTHDQATPGKERTVVKAACGTGEHVLGGGGHESGTFGTQRLVGSAPFDSSDNGDAPDDGWRIAVDNVKRKQRSATAFAVCADLGGLSYQSTGFTIGGASRGGGSAPCPASEYVVGGGVSQDGAFGKEALVTTRYAITHDEWQAELDNLANSDINGHVFAVCHS